MLRQETWSFTGRRFVWHCVAMMKIRKANERGHAEHGWLDTYHSFSFADYYDPKWMGYRTLRVINDDLVMPGQGFGMHPHRDMEIVTYILSGALHSEFNPSTEEAVRLLQIWIMPDEKGVKPGYAEKSFAKAPAGFYLVTS